MYSSIDSDSKYYVVITWCLLLVCCGTRIAFCLNFWKYLCLYLLLPVLPVVPPLDSSVQDNSIIGENTF